MSRVYGNGVDGGVYWIASQALDDPTILEYCAQRAGKPGEWLVMASYDLLDVVLREAPTPLPSLVKHCPDAVWRFLQKAMERDPERRFQSYDEFGSELDVLIDALTGDEERDQRVLRDLLNDAQLDPDRTPEHKRRTASRDASGAAMTPRTVPPGANTRRRVRVALREASVRAEDEKVDRPPKASALAALLSLAAPENLTPPPPALDDGAEADQAPDTSPGGAPITLP